MFVNKLEQKCENCKNCKTTGDAAYFSIGEELKKLPTKPGVYLMHDENDEIIYVGKAVNLRNRVRQYFTAGKNRGAKIEQMITKVRRFEYIVTDSEIEALVLECNLIKENRPRYNTMLMDDKGYPFIKVTVDEPYPRVMLAHKMQKDKAKYFGPFTNSKAVRDTVELIRKIYHVRSCSRNLPKEIGKGRPCLNYHIGKCMAPCQGYVSEEEYRKSTEGVLRFLGGHYDDVLKSLDNAMKKAADDLEFEKAIEYRDLKNSVSRIEERQKITDSSGGDRDIVAVASDDTDAVVQVFFTRGGRITGREHFFMRNAAGMRKSELLGNFIKQFYSGTPFIPGELMLQEKAEDQTLIEEWLGKKRGKNVRIRVPQKGEKEKLIELARENAGIVLKSDKERLKAEEGRTIGAVKEIEVLLGLKDIVRMESYDISNISGYDSVGSMVVYERGKPKRTDYRKFRIKDVQGPDDYAGMEEMLTRRFSRGLKEREEENEAGGFSKFPDLLLMDGGKGQVNAALKVLKKLGLTIPVCGMVKDDAHRTRGIYYENEEIPVEKDSEGFKLITRIQDETHRFAIEYHRKLRSKEQVHSILDDIKGIGPKRRKALMKSFPGIDALKSASLEDLKKVPSMNEKSAVEVYNFFHA